MRTYFKHNRSKNLILFFNGWALDEKPFNLLNCESDILFISDYFNFHSDFLSSFDFSRYQKITLIGYSAGVFMANYLHEQLPKLDYKIAINGTLNLFHPELGLPENIVFEMKNITLENALRFRSKVITDKKQVELFNKNQPDRDLESCLNELFLLQKYYLENRKHEIEFDKIIISKDDKLIPIERQTQNWNSHSNVKEILGGHFPFFNYENFEQIINL